MLKGDKNKDGTYEKQPVIVQGITGKFGSVHTKLMLEYGTNIVAGVTPGKGGQKFEGVPIYETVKESVSATGAKISIVFVPAKFFLDAAKEAFEAGIKLLVAIPEHVPVRDTMQAIEIAKQNNAIMVGPNTPGIIIPNLIKIGIMPASPFAEGNIAVLSKSGTLLYEISNSLTTSGFGQIFTLGIGGDPITGTSFIDVLTMFENDNQTDAVVLIGEIGGTREQEAAEFIKTEFSKPIAALIVGQSAPPGKRMGHAGAIITGEAAKASEKIRSLSNAGASIIPSPGEIGSTINQIINN